MIALKNVVFGYDRHRKVFSNLTLTLPQGHIHGLLGCNGVGKSTLLRLICGLLAPDSGEVSVDGHCPHQRSAGMLAQMLFVPEETSLPDIPFRRFAALTGAFYPGYSPAEFASHCAALGIDPALAPRSMSLGERKKAHIAFALACNTLILLLDEPTNGLDIPSKTVFRRLLAGYADEQRTIVVSTHQVREIEELVDNVIICDKQGLVLDATTDLLAERLTFGALPANRLAFYREQELTGDAGIAANTSGKESCPRLEMLFNAVTADRNTIPAYLNTKTESHE